MRHDIFLTGAYKLDGEARNIFHVDPDCKRESYEDIAASLIVEAYGKEAALSLITPDLTLCRQWDYETMIETVRNFDETRLSY